MRKIHAFWGLAAGLLVLAGLALCALGLERGTLLVKSARAPGETVSDFFAELSAGDWENAYSHLSNYRSLGLENSPRTEEGALLLSALRESYDCTLLSPALLLGSTATQTVRLRFLNLSAVEQALLAQETPDLAALLASPEKLCGQADFTLTLVFDGENWLIQVDEALLDAIQGCVPGEGAA